MNLDLLEDFLRNATLATYAGDGIRFTTEKRGFYDLEYAEGDFYYRDSYAGFLSSHGQETVWYRDRPAWMCSYAGGMVGSKTDDVDFAHNTFVFLKMALQSGKSGETFRPRGSESFGDVDWEYVNDYSGDVSRFSGHEEIMFKSELVFVHDYFGGMLRFNSG